MQSTQNTAPSTSSSRSRVCLSECPFGRLEQFPWPSATETSLICYWPVGIHTNSLVETTHRGTRHLFSNPAGGADRCMGTKALRHSGPSLNSVVDAYQSCLIPHSMEPILPRSVEKGLNERNIAALGGCRARRLRLRVVR